MGVGFASDAWYEVHKRAKRSSRDTKNPQPGAGSRAQAQAPCSRYWLILDRESDVAAVLTIALPDGEGVLPIFSSEEEAGPFIRLGPSGREWQAEEAAPEDVLCVLFGPRGGVERVALDAVPGLEADVLVELISLDRERFAALTRPREGPRTYCLSMAARIRPDGDFIRGGSRASP